MTIRSGFIILILPLLCFLFPPATGAEGFSGTAASQSDNLSEGFVRLCKVNSKDTPRGGARGLASERTDSGRFEDDAETPSGGTPALVTDLRYWSNPDYTRVVVVLDREVGYTYHKLRRDYAGSLPERLYIDLSGARIAPGVKDVPIKDGLLKMARVGQFRPNVVRVVLDIENIRDYKVFPLSDPFRVIIDVKGERPTEISRLDESIRAAEPESDQPKPAGTKGRTAVSGKFEPAKIRRIVIDPGHGGHDPGAVGADGLNEKDVVLSMGKKLAVRIKNMGIDVVMTRSTDVFIPLEERTAIANKVNADLFISIHANAALNKSASGVETYYLNLAKTDKAARVAARENNTSLEKVGLLQTILFDLMANYKINDSARLAEEVQKSLHGRLNKKFGGIKNLGVKQGPFYVLVGATMPSILVETAFISNKREADLLREEKYQDAAVSGILEGIQSYIKDTR